MDNICSWCVKTSEQIDSIEYQLETLTEENRALKHRLAEYEQPIKQIDIGLEKLKEYHIVQAI